MVNAIGRPRKYEPGQAPQIISIYLAPEKLTELNKRIKEGKYPSRNAAILFLLESANPKLAEILAERYAEWTAELKIKNELNRAEAERAERMEKAAGIEQSFLWEIPSIPQELKNDANIELTRIAANKKDHKIDAGMLTRKDAELALSKSLRKLKKKTSPTMLKEWATQLMEGRKAEAILQ